MLNRYDHEDAEPLRDSVRAVLPTMAELIEQTRAAGASLVYVNDNHGDWTVGREAMVDWALGGEDPALVEPIAPQRDVPFLVKARHSAFYATQLDYLLRQAEVERVVLVGQVTEQCILYSALDAYVRHFELVVPRDAVAHIDEQLAAAALRMMERNMRADVVDAGAALQVLTG
ncbi:cysteine hydrolase [Baekduia soli]|uniref:Cysteine hydrolase n=2 Tax=Baekduia soli TaxID=496014 RepID=A0A5B8UDM6_9ACTN|nr:cysteine hydrolase [Baekduia soli]